MRSSLQQTGSDWPPRSSCHGPNYFLASYNFNWWVHGKFTPQTVLMNKKTSSKGQSIFLYQAGNNFIWTVQLGFITKRLFLNWLTSGACLLWPFEERQWLEVATWFSRGRVLLYVLAQGFKGVVVVEYWKMNLLGWFKELSPHLPHECRPFIPLSIWQPFNPEFELQMSFQKYHLKKEVIPRLLNSHLSPCCLALRAQTTS